MAMCPHPDPSAEKELLLSQQNGFPPNGLKSLRLDNDLLQDERILAASDPDRLRALTQL
jgi:hypothetical protein